MSHAGSETARPSLITPPGIGKRCLFLLAWFPVGSLTFILAAGLVQGLPVWLMSEEERLWLQIVLLAFLLSSLVPGALVLLGGRLRCWLMWSLTAAIFGGIWYLASLLGHAVPLSGLALLAAVAALLNFCLPPAAQGRWRVLLLPAGLATLIALCSLPIAGDYAPVTQLYYGFRLPQRKVLETTVYPVHYTLFRAPLPIPEVFGGGLATVRNTVLLVTGDGEFYRLDISAQGDRLKVEPLGYKVPINTTALRAQGLQYREYRRFRVHGVLLLAPGDADHVQVLVTHHYFHEAENCTTVRLSSFSASTDEFVTGRANPQWRTLYETQPCLPLKVDGKVFFSGHQAGGRMQQESATKVLVSVGDHGYDGVNSPHIAPQDMRSDYGKILEIDTVTGSHRIFSSGFRNPQGLYRDKQGNIWATDHGPKGGDELDLIHEGKNYGWPVETFGANYEHYTWPRAGAKPPALDLSSPALAWLPSVAVSNLTGIDHGVFERWRGDLLMGSLRAKSVYRIHLEGTRPVFNEAILLEECIRDLALDAKGRIVLWTDDGRIGLLAPLPDPD